MARDWREWLLELLKYLVTFCHKYTYYSIFVHLVVVMFNSYHAHTGLMEPVLVDAAHVTEDFCVLTNDANNIHDAKIMSTPVTLLWHNIYLCSDIGGILFPFV